MGAAVGVVAAAFILRWVLVHCLSCCSLHFRVARELNTPPSTILPLRMRSLSISPLQWVPTRRSHAASGTKTRPMGSTADNESLAVVTTSMHRAELTVNCVQASFNLGHTVDTTEPIEWPVGVEMQRVDHLTRTWVEGITSELPKMVLEFFRPGMATVTIYPSGKVEVSRASSETAAQAAAETVNNSLFRPEDADAELYSTFRITQIIATYAVLPKVINKGTLYPRLKRMYQDTLYEPELRSCVQLTLNQGAVEGVSKGRVVFEFFHKKIIVRGNDLGAGGSVLMQKRFLEVFDGVRIDGCLTEELQAGSRSAADLIVETNGQNTPDVREALEKAVRRIVPGGRLNGLGDRPARDPAGGFISRHLQIQKWLREKHPDLTQLPDYDPEWGDPGKANVRSWANTPWAGFWEEHMRPVFADQMRNLKRKRDEQEPVELSKRLYHYSDTLTNSDTAIHESPACATSRHNVIAIALQLAEAMKEHQQLASNDTLLGDGQSGGAGYISTSAGGAVSAPKFRSCSGDDSAPSCTDCSADDSAPSAGARRATAGHILPWPSTACRRSYAGVVVSPDKKLTVGEANEAPYDVASRMLQALGAFACPEMADLHNECVRICKLIIAN